MVLNPLIQLFVVILYTKCELSILYSCGKFFDEKFWEKEKRTYTGKRTGERLFSVPQCNKILTFYLGQLLRNLLWEITISIAWRERTKAGSPSHATTCRFYIVYQKWVFYLIQLWRYFDEKCREKEKWINIRKNKQEKAGSQSHDTTSL